MTRQAIAIIPADSKRIDTLSLSRSLIRSYFPVPAICLHQSLPSTIGFVVPINCLYQQCNITRDFLVLIKSLHQYFDRTNGLLVPKVSLYELHTCTNHFLVQMVLQHQEIICTSNLIVQIASQYQRFFCTNFAFVPTVFQCQPNFLLRPENLGSASRGDVVEPQGVTRILWVAREQSGEHWGSQDYAPGTIGVLGPGWSQDSLNYPTAQLWQ